MIDLRYMELKASQNKQFKDFLENDQDLIGLKKKYQTPSHFLFPKSFGENIKKFKEVLEEYDIRYRVFYAHKSNKTPTFLEVCKENDIGVDVASYNELQNALNKDIVHMEASGPKNRKFLKSCLDNNITIAIDSFSEAEVILQIKKEENIGRKTPILIRISGFGGSAKSRFGIEIGRKEEIINFLEKNEDDFDFFGCSMHIDTESVSEKILAIEELLGLYRELQKKGIRARILNIGGGFGISYLEDKKSWISYKNLLKEELMDESIEMSWKKQGYGFRRSQSAVTGEGNIYAPFRDVSGERNLKEMLDSPLREFGDMRLGEYLSENIISLRVEPGRSLHDFSALSMSEVISVKRIGEETLVTLDINSFGLGAREQELFSDPIIISSRSKKTKKGVFLTGNLCLESDFISKHKIFFGCIPEVGDLMIFLNTGGYLMDFYETTSISQELAKKIVYYSKEEHYAL